MNILYNFLRGYKERAEIPKRDLLLFAIAVLREAERLEHENTGTPGKVAIEFILNIKYHIAESPKIESHAKDLVLAELDSVINKVVAKYHIQRKGKEFYFKESVAILEPAGVIGPVGSGLLSDLYIANTELEVLRIQLTRVNLQSSECYRIKQAIREKEQQIRDIKVAITKQRYFSHTCDQNNSYYRAIGEEAKDNTKAGAVVGAAGGATVAKHKAIKDTRHNQNRNQANKAINYLDKIQKKASKELDTYVNNRNLTNIGRKSKEGATKLAKEAKEALRELSKKKAIGNKYKSQALNRLQKSGVKVTQSAVKGGAKGALLGAAAGLATYGAKKALENKSESLKEKLDRYLIQTRRK